MEKIRENWLEFVGEKDTVVLPGDFSWGSNFEESRTDFEYLCRLPGRKILLKGNHDYWWTTKKKITDFFESAGISDIEIIHNSCVLTEGVALCGTRGWGYDDELDPEQNKKLFERENGRLDMSLAEAGKSEIRVDEKIAFLHYPPVLSDYKNDAVVDILVRHGVRRCFYGHLHAGGMRRAYNGEYRGVEFRLVSADYVDFYPVRIV